MNGCGTGKRGKRVGGVEEIRDLLITQLERVL